jgi:hypothetical protein
LLIIVSLSAQRCCYYYPANKSSGRHPWLPNDNA